jgi:hypothetical protein
MTTPVDAIRIGANGQVRVAPVGTVAPADFAAPWVAGWVNLGRTDENGAQLTDSKTIADISVWQSLYPARKIITARTFEAVFTLRDWTRASVALAFGGGTWTEGGTGIHQYHPPSPETVDTRTLAVDWQDSGHHYRFVITEGLVSGNVQTKLVRNAAADLPITFDAIGVDGADPWQFITDDPTFAA